MKDILGVLNDLRRPRLLIRAARAGVGCYDRDKHLTHALGSARLPRSGEALMRLMEIESTMNEARRSEDATYTIRAHVEVLTAMMGEARVLRESRYA